MRDGRYLIGWGTSTALRFASSRPGTARAVLNADGTALVQTATQDIGTGTYTIMAQIAADALGLRVERIRGEIADTDLPPGPPSFGSLTAQSVSATVTVAGNALRDKVIGIAIADRRSPLFGAAPADVVVDDGAGHRQRRLPRHRPPHPRTAHHSGQAALSPGTDSFPSAGGSAWPNYPSRTGGTTMASKQSQAVKAMYASWAAARRDGEEQDLESWGDLTAEPRGVDYLETDAGGVPAMWAVPKGCGADRVLLCMHGGGFVGGSIYTHRKLFGHLAKAVGARALIIDYRLTPEHIHPAQVDDALTAYRWLLEQGISATHIAFTGDSSGGGLAITTLLRAREQNLPLPAMSMPISPWVDMEVIGETYESNQDKDPFFHREMVQELVSMFLGDGGSPRDPLTNPLYADLTGLPPIYIQVGGDETLLDDARRLAERARQAGVDVRLDVFSEQQHTFQMMAGRAPEADDAIRRLADWARPRLGG